jgi:endonuclease/exonuclease/phosphatase family metal-dependent hydrolase
VSSDLVEVNIMNEGLMWIIGLSFPAFVSLLVLYLQERALHQRQRQADYIAKERAYVLIEGDMNSLKNTTEKMSVVLDRVDDRMDALSERVARVEAKLP